MELQVAHDVLNSVVSRRGIMWDKIESFQKYLNTLKGTVNHKAGTEQSKILKDICPIKQHIDGGLYTREIFMPKGSLIVSMIHKQNHPSFLLKGKLSFLNDDGIVQTIEGPYKIFTKIGTQRVLYIHEDSTWCCVYKTNAKTYEEAEADVYTNNYKDLPSKIINKYKKLWQELEL